MKQLKIENLFKFNFFNSANSEEIRRAFQKSSFRSQLSNFKEGSPSWIAQKAKEDAIRDMITVDLKYDYKDLEITYSYHKVKFLMISYDEVVRDYEGEEYTITRNFLCTNSHWGEGVITSMQELISDTDVLRLIFLSQEEAHKDKLRKRITDFDERFSVMTEYLLKIETWDEEITFWRHGEDNTPIIKVGEQEFSMTDISKIYDAYKDEVVFYDKNDRKIDQYSFECYYEYYMRCNQ